MNVIGIIKQKPQFEKICDLKSEGFFTFPREDNTGSMYVISSTGEIFQFNESTSEHVLTLNANSCCGLCFDNNGLIYVSDLNNSSIFFKQMSAMEQNPLIESILAKDFDGTSLKGPNALTYNRNDNVLYFADSGNFDSGSITPRDTTIYAVDLETRVLRKLISNISFVNDICYDSNRECLYLAETFMNRIIRLKQNDNGIFISNVFYQFTGRIGPTALTLDENGNLFVARFEYSSADMDMDIEADGIISVLNKEGILLGELTLPELPEIMGLYISPKKRENLYFTERNSTGVFLVKLSSFINDIDKYEEVLNVEYKENN